MEKKEVEPETLLTSHEVGDLIQVNPTSVNKWVADGLIPAFRTPGGHRRIRAVDLVSFLDAHKMPIPREIEGIAKRRALIVDDDAKLVKTFERTFKKYAQRVSVQTASNGIDALVAVGSFKPHLIVLDVFMPEVDGLEVCRRLKANPETAHISVLMTSAQLKADLEKKAKDVGATRYAPKPLDIAVILELLGLAQLAAAS